MYLCCFVLLFEVLPQKVYIQKGYSKANPLFFLTRTTQISMTMCGFNNQTIMTIAKQTMMMTMKKDNKKPTNNYHTHKRIPPHSDVVASG